MVLRFCEDLSEAQTAELMDCSVGTVKRQVFVALGKLREHLGSDFSTALIRSADDHQGPAGHDSNHKADKNPGPDEPPAQARKIVYSDVPAGPNGLAGDGDTVHYGDRVVETGVGFTQIDVTDDGFVYTTAEGRHLWFSDGGEPEQIGSDLCRDEAGFRGVQVKTANEGSLVAWLVCSQTAPVDLVVFDTSQDREVARQPIARCGTESGAPLTRRGLVPPSLAACATITATAG